MLSPLNGLYTTPEIDQAFRDATTFDPLDKWLRVMLGINAIAFGLTALSYFYAVLTEVTPLPAMSPGLDAFVTVLTYVVALVGLLRWPIAANTCSDERSRPRIVSTAR